MTPVVLRLLAALAGLALALAGQLNVADPPRAIALFAIGAFVFILSGGPGKEPAPPPARPVPFTWRTVGPVAVGIALAAGAMIGWWQNRFQGDASNLTLAVYLVGLAALGWGLGRLGRAEGVAAPPRRLWELLAVAAIIAAGFWFRTHQLNDLPWGVWYDEADSALEAVQINSGAPYSPAAFHFRYNPSMYFEFLAVGFRAFGTNIYAVRIVTVFFALLSIPALYVLVRALFGRPAALMAAFVLAFSRWHVDFSRFGMSNISATLFAIAAMYFLWRGLKSGRWSDYAWCGLWFGLGLHTYTAFKIFPLAGALLLGGWFLRHPIDLGRLLPRYLLLGLVAAIGFGPLLVFTLQNPAEANQRVFDASVFAGKKTDQERKDALVSNVQKHALMFNVRGDANGRHNLPGEPELDPVAGAFFVVGVAFALVWTRQLRFVLVLVWLAVALLAGILSLDFEAPQSTRALLVVPAAAVLVVLPPARAWGLAARFGRDLSRRRPRALAYALPGAAAAVAFGAIAHAEADLYFGRQAHDPAVWAAFSAQETAVAREIARLGPGYRYLISDFYVGHPTLGFLVPWLRDYGIVKDAQVLPLTGSGGAPVVLFLDPEKRPIYTQARHLYPDGQFREIGPAFGGPPAVYQVVLAPAVIEGLQGLAARYYPNADWQGPPALERRDRAIAFTAPPAELAGKPLSVEWQGVLRITQYGPYNLFFSGPGAGPIELDGREVAPDGPPLMLAEGNHALRLRYADADGRLDARFEWQPAGGPRQLVPPEALYGPPVTSNGLLGKYYAGRDWAGLPTLERIDPQLALYFHLPPLRRPYSVEWTGYLNAPPGAYRFGLESIDDSWLEIDGQPVVETHVPNAYVEAPFALGAGPHAVRVRFLDLTGFTHINLYWTPPGGPRQILPAAFLTPGPPGPGTPPPALESAPATVGPAPAPAGAGPELPFTPLRTIGGPGSGPGQFAAPRGLAVDSAGNLYVADAGNRRVQKFDRDGKLLAALGKPGAGEGEFQDPAALAVNARDELLVLDAENGWVSRFAPDGRFLGRVAGPTAAFFHPRGLAVDPAGNLYIADTGHGQVPKLDPAGRGLTAFGRPGAGPGALREPTGVLLLPDGALLLVDPTAGKLLRFAADGALQAEAAFPNAATVDGPHLALLPDGTVLATDPANHRLLRFDPGLKPLGAYGHEGTAPGAFRVPVALAVAPDGTIYVAESAGNRVQALRP